MCKINNYLQLDNSTCDSQCVSFHTYADDNERKCMACNETCGNCEGNGPNNCTNCTDDNYFLNPDKSCTLDCQNNSFYKDFS